MPLPLPDLSEDDLDALLETEPAFAVEWESEVMSGVERIVPWAGGFVHVPDEGEPEALYATLDEALAETGLLRLTGGATAVYADGPAEALAARIDASGLPVGHAVDVNDAPWTVAGGRLVPAE